MKKMIGCLILLLGIQNAYAWTIKLSEDELQAKINRLLPIEKKKLLFTVQISSLDVELTEGSERIGLIADMEIKSPHLSTGKGRATIDGNLAYHPADGVFYFHDAQVRDITFENIPAKYHKLLKKIFQRVMTRRLAKTPIYTLNANKAKHQLAKVLLKSVMVIDQKLVLELGLL